MQGVSYFMGGEGRGTTVADMARLLRCGVSATAICVFALSAPAFAQTGAASGQNTAGSTSPTNAPSADQTTNPQDATGTATPPTSADQGQAGNATDDAGSNDVVVTGIRQSLANAQNIKRNADTVVDAITAQDIGALPDRSVTEALQRVPGVSINRFAGSNDPDHFSVEGSGVTVRGLTFVRSEFNGRDTFSAGIGGQAINFADVPSELLGSVEIFKNATADLIEGGLAGTVNLNTRKPFDNKGLHVAFNSEANYGDFRKKWAPTGSLLLSDTFDTAIGRFGFLANASYSRLKTRADGIQVTNFQTRDGVSVAGANSSGTVCRNRLPSSVNTTTLPAAGSCGAAQTGGPDGFADLLPLAYAPIGGQSRTQDFDRKRDGQALAVQWQSTDEKTVFSAQFLRTHSTNAWGEHTFESAPDLSEYNTYPLGCNNNANSPTGSARAECPVGALQNYTYGSDGLFQKGYITLPNGGWRGSLTNNGQGYIPAGGISQSLSRRQVFDENEVKDAGFNLKHDFDDHFSMNLDVDYTRARHDVVDFSVFGETFASQELDLTGNLPVITPHKPAVTSPLLTGLSDADYFRSPNVQFWRAAMDHIEHSQGDEYQIKGDFTYKFDDGSFLNRVKFGARYSERQQEVQYSAYNWGVLSEVWAGTSPVSIAQGGPTNAEFYTFPNFFRDKTAAPPGAFYYNGDLIGNYGGSAAYFKGINNLWVSANGGSAGWNPAGQRAGTVAGTSFLPSEIQNVGQQDTGAYVMLNFGGADPLIGGIRLSGNVGVRYVSTDISSSGQIGAPTTTQTGTNLPFAERCRTSDPDTGRPIALTGVCLLGPAGYASLAAFSTGLTTPEVARNSYHYFLPSLNLKFGLSNDVVVRLAGSRVLTRPDAANIRDFLQVGFDTTSGQLQATAGNPFLKPALAWQADATLEWYFARVGSLTFNAYYKSIDNFFYNSIITRNISSNGQTRAVTVRGPANYDGSGKIKGFEVAYQQTFDFLPGLLNGLGTNLNYSYIESSGLPNSFLNGGTPSSTSTITPGNLPLEQLSKHNVNATVFYEKGPVSLRAAYNWRSRFLLTASDVIFPYTSIFNEATGSLDASAFFNVTKIFKIGVQGVNLTNTVLKTSQAFTGDPNRLAPRSYFINDRRYSFILRANY